MRSLAIWPASSPHQALQGQGIAPRLPLVVQDVRLLLLRLAHQENLSVDCGGGAARSNLQLVPYQLQVSERVSHDFFAPCGLGACSCLLQRWCLIGGETCVLCLRVTRAGSCLRVSSLKSCRGLPDFTVNGVSEGVIFGPLPA